LLYGKAGFPKPRIAGGFSEKPDLNSVTAETTSTLSAGNAASAINHVAPVGTDFGYIKTFSSE